MWQREIQFLGEEFIKFDKDWDFEITLTSLYHANSIGMAESAVKMAKRMIQRAVHSGRDPYFSILDLKMHS